MSMNQLRRIKNYHSASDENMDILQQEDLAKKSDSDSEDQIMDLSNIRNITDLNQLTKMQKDFVDIDNIELDIEESDEQQLENLMRLQQYDDEPKPAFNNIKSSHQQIQQELRDLLAQDLLAQSSSEQLLQINEENAMMSDGDKKDDIVIGEHPVGNKLDSNTLFEEEPDNKDILQRINSPPLVTSAVSSIRNTKPGSKEDEKKEASPKHVVNFNQDLRQNGPDTSTKAAFGELLPSSSAGAMKSEPKSPQPRKESAAEAAGENQEGDENDSFHRLYNKEIKVNQDEIPLLLLELTDIAFKFIKKDSFEKAYVLLQKTESVLEVVNLDHSKRDKYFAYITYHNMAMCFQKLGMLEECILYLKETIQVIEKPNFFKDVSIGSRMKAMHMQCQLKLQLCAILSQNQKHTEAMENAKASVRLAHQILRDLYDLCVFYSNKIKFKDDFASLSLLVMDESEDLGDNKAQNSTNYYQDDIPGKANANKSKHTKSEINEKLFQKQFIRENSPVRDIPYNILEESISMIERTALRLLPIMKELGNKLAGTTGNKGKMAFHTNMAADSIDLKGSVTEQSNLLDAQKKELESQLQNKKANNDKGLVLGDEKEDEEDSKAQDKDGKKDGKTNEDQIDMRTILGFLNQNEWILNLNIGNIMQIQPVRMKDFLQSYRNEHQLSRESFLEKLQLLIVSYFCVSTELRFIVQSRSGFMKAETKKEKELEQEYWHVKALDISCAFLPSECPLFNHILLSYQKHHDPSMQPIEEDKEADDVLHVLRPLRGIENSKFQPIIREVKNVYIDIAEINLSPLSKCFDQRLLPKKMVKNSTQHCQTEEVQKEQPKLMQSQCISVQDDLKIDDLATKQEVKDEDISNLFDNKNAYQDLTSSNYQENLISKIIDDAKIKDKTQFLNKLISRVQSQDPEKFKQLGSMTHANTQSQNFNNLAYFSTDHGGQKALHDHISGTLSSDPIDDTDIYGRGPYGKKKGMHKNKTKNTQSGQINYKHNLSKGPKNPNKFDEFMSYDEQNVGKMHMNSMYGDSSIGGNTHLVEGGVKHHIASQSLAPSQSVLTSKKPLKGYSKNHKDLVTHKKNQSISGVLTGGIGLNTSQQKDMLKSNSKVKNTIDHSSTLLKPGFNNSVTSNLSKNKKKSISKMNTSQNNISQISQSKNSAFDQTSKKNHMVNNNSGMIDKSADTGKSRPSSAITNYTSGQSALRNAKKMNLAKRQNQLNQHLHNINTAQKSNQKLLQQQQNIIKQKKQAKQKFDAQGNPIVAKKNSKMLSRKKYGSDKSSNSPQNQQYPLQNQHLSHGYSIANQPVSIFDSGNTHSISKLSNQQQQNQGGLQTSASQNLKDSASIHNQSDNILSKLQNLLVDKAGEDKHVPKKLQASNLHLRKQQNSYENHQNITSSLGRKPKSSINSNVGSQSKITGYRSRYSLQSHSRKSRASRSKSSGKSKRSKSNSRSRGEKTHKSISNERKLLQSKYDNLMQNYLENEDLNQRSMDTSHFQTHMLTQNTEGRKQKGGRSSALRARPKSSLLFDHLQNEQNLLPKNPKKKQTGNVKKRGTIQNLQTSSTTHQNRAQHNNSIETLQRQVLQNQKILLNNMNTYKTSKNSKRAGKRHNHNNSISQMNNINDQLFNSGSVNHNMSMLSKNNFNQLNHNLFQTTTSKKKSQTGQKKVQSRPQIQNYNPNQKMQGIGPHSSSGAAINIQNSKSNLQSLKMTQQHLSQNLKNLAMMNNLSSTSTNNQFQSGKSKSRKSTNHKRRSSITGGAKKEQKQFVNFEQMQQQLEGGMTLGGVDLMTSQQQHPVIEMDSLDQNSRAFQEKMVNLTNFNQGGLEASKNSKTSGSQAFIPHKNLMPKTTGSQAHLLQQNLNKYKML